VPEYELLLPHPTSVIASKASSVKMMDKYCRLY